MDEESFQQIRQVVEELIPFNKFLGLKLERLEEGQAQVSFGFKPELVGNFVQNILHGGVLAAVLDVTGALAVAAARKEPGPQKLSMATVDLRIDYLNPARGDRFICHGRVVRIGKALATSQVEVACADGQPLAMAMAVYRLLHSFKHPEPTL